MKMRSRFLLALTLAALPAIALAVPFWGAKESLPPETSAEQLKPGEWVWAPAVSASGPIVVVVELGAQLARVYRNGVEIGFASVSSGKKGHETPTGVFTILQKDKDHRSSKYNNAPMPYTQRLTWDGVALHAGGLPGYPSSHGCVHLPSRFAEELFAVSPMGMTVVVIDERSAPAEMAHPAALAPVDAVTGAPAVVSPLEPGQEFRLEPEKSPHGPVSVVISAADQRVIVLRNGVEIGRARIALQDPSQPLGTHAYVMQEGTVADTNPLVPDQPMGRWLAVGMPGHYDDAGRMMSTDAAGAVRVHHGFARAIYPLLAPGSTLLVTDAPMLAHNSAPQLTVLTSGTAE
jgi:hypothetical protein